MASDYKIAPGVNGKMEDNDLIQKKRDRQIMEIVRHFLLAVVTFRQQYQNYKQGSLQFADLAKLVDDRGQSLLYALKELSHALYRRSSAIISEKEQRMRVENECRRAGEIPIRWRRKGRSGR